MKTFRGMNCEGRWRYALALWFFLATAIFLLGLAFLVTGAVYGKRGLWLFATGALALVVSLPALAIFLWYVFCRSSRSRGHRDEGTASQLRTYDGPLSVIDASRSLSEAELRSDYPMGPLLIMTLPRPRQDNQRLANIPTGDSPVSNPGFGSKRHQASRNYPPLASEETLSPSLKSSLDAIHNAI